MPWIPKFPDCVIPFCIGSLESFTKAAKEKNAENLLIIHSKELAKVYLENWQKHREHSEVHRRQ